MDSFYENHILNTDFLKYLSTNSKIDSSVIEGVDSFFPKGIFLFNFKESSIEDFKAVESIEETTIKSEKTEKSEKSEKTEKSEKRKRKLNPERKANPVFKLISVLLEVSTKTQQNIDNNMIFSVLSMNYKEYLPFDDYNKFVNKMKLIEKNKFSIIYKENLIKKKNFSKKPKQKCCSCSNSHCLKLYCQCFRSKVDCKSCDCNQCFNKSNYYIIREVSFLFIKGKKKSIDSVLNAEYCSCSKNNCMNNYCICKKSNGICSERCKCVGCKLV